jgi:hypothetical protein
MAQIPTLPHRGLFSDKATYKSNVNQRSSTLRGLGYLERLVLDYASKCYRGFTPSDVRVYLNEKYGLRISRDRVQKACKRLVDRGILVKVKRGWYRLRDNVDYSTADLKASRAVEVALERANGGGIIYNRVLGCFGGGVVGGGVLRVHSLSACGLFGFYFEVCFVYYSLGVLLRGLEVELRRFGFSGGLLRRVKRVARGLAGYSCCVYGGHSRWGGGRCKPLQPLSLISDVRFREIGVDMFPDRDPPKIHLKIYTTINPYATTPLHVWARG